MTENKSGTIEYRLRTPGGRPRGAVRNTREEILADKRYVEKILGPYEAIQRTVSEWTEVEE